MKLTLSICIPTYNRISNLKTCLGFLIPQVDAAPAGCVEVVIVDNASTDETPAYIDIQANTHTFIRVFHNPINIGLDGNTAKCIEYAQGEYTALLSDDDFYLQGQVAQILNVLSQGTYALVRLNFQTFLEDPHIPYQTFRPETDVVLKDAYDMYDVRSFHNGGHFSGIIYRSALAKEALAKMLAAAPLNTAERSRGVYGELEIRIAKTTALQAYFIGKRLLATSIPQTLSYAGLEHICLDYLNIYNRWQSQSLITAEEFAIHAKATIDRLPQMIVTFTPGMTNPDIRHVTHGFNKYLETYAKYRYICLPLLYISQMRVGKCVYSFIHRIARIIKRTVINRSKVLIVR